MSFDGLIAKTLSVVWKPGVASSGIVVATWEEVQAFIALRQGAVEVYVDSSIAPASVSPGITECFGRATFLGASSDLSAPSQLTLPEGAVLQNPARFSRNLVVAAQASATPVMSFTSGGGLVIFENGTSLDNQGVAPIARLAVSRPVMAVFIFGGTFTPTAGALFDLPTAPADASVLTVETGGMRGDNVFTGVAGTSASFSANSGGGQAPTNPGFAGTFTAKLSDDARLTGYSPGAPSDWITSPVQTAQALDELAMVLSRSPAIVYKPGAPSSGLTVATWAEVQAFIAFRRGAAILYVDDSIISPALVPGSSGISDCFGRLEIRPFIIDSTNYSVLQIEDGATLQNLYSITDVEVRCNSQSATPSLNFSGTSSGGTLILQEFGLLSQAATATQPGVSVPPGTRMLISMSGDSAIVKEGFNDFTIPLFAVPATANLTLLVLDTSLVFNNYAAGAGSVNFDFDNSSAAEFFPIATPPTLPGLTGTYTKEDASIFLGDVTGAALTSKVVAWQNKLLDPVTMVAPALNNVPRFDGTKWVASTVAEARIDFTASTADIFSPASVGIRRVRWQGCGAGGGGAGGGGGGVSAGNAGGEGGGGGGGATLQTFETDIDLSHRIDVVIGAGGTPGVAGTPDTGAGAGTGGLGGDGGSTYVFDFTTSTVLATFSGASGGAGGSGGTSGGPFALSSAGGCTFSGSQAVNPNNGFPAAGGPGGVGGALPSGGFSGNTGLFATGAALPGTGLFSGGAGGTTGGTIEGGGGGGGGAGPYGGGATGGNGVDGPGTAGGDATANSGAGAGGGGGGESAVSPVGTQPGGPGGTGGSGRLTGFYLV